MSNTKVRPAGGLQGYVEDLLRGQLEANIVALENLGRQLEEFGWHAATSLPLMTTASAAREAALKTRLLLATLGLVDAGPVPAVAAAPQAVALPPGPHVSQRAAGAPHGGNTLVADATVAVAAAVGERPSWKEVLRARFHRQWDGGTLTRDRQHSGS